jgi:hypothetical protein
VTVLPASRTSNRSPKPCSKISSGGTRESEHDRMAANGDCPPTSFSRLVGSRSGCRSFILEALIARHQSSERLRLTHGRSIRAGSHTNCGVRNPQIPPFAVTRAHPSNAAGGELPNLVSCALRRRPSPDRYQHLDRLCRMRPSKSAF